MDSTNLESRLGDFTLQANAYAKSRPDYPADLVEALIRESGVAAGDEIAEIGAGTGIFTRWLSERGLRVNAIDPNAPMMAQAPTLPGVEYRTGTFEQTGLADRSQAWVVAAQAFHWANPVRALPEIRRVLIPGRCFSVLWNDRLSEQSPVLMWIDSAITRHIPEYRFEYRTRDWAATLVSTGDFDHITACEQVHEVAMSRERFFTLWQSNNQIAVTAGPERLKALLADVADYLARERLETIRVPYACQAWTARAR